MVIQKQKVEFFETLLLDYFQKSGRSELPWRTSSISAYHVWVSEIMLQQTQVSRVIEYYVRFLKKYPTVQSLAKSSWEEFLPYYQGLGYYARGRNMLKTSEAIVKQYGGEFPKTKPELTALPGIGEYTAAAILSFAYNKKELAWDTNLKRVIGRFFYGTKNAPIEFEKLEQMLRGPRKKLNAALMDFGSSICTARPKCANCPLQQKCVYYKERGEKEQKTTKEKNSFPVSEARALVFLHEYHRHYYSAHKKKFTPFLLPPASNSRKAIKAFFFETYNLQLSVRPPHTKKVIDGIPTLLINAQILAGNPDFAIFPKQAVTEYTENNLK